MKAYDVKLIREEWIKDLESGQFTQTTGGLERVDCLDHGNCCLGVLCRTFDRLYPGVLSISNYDELVAFNQAAHKPPQVVRDAVGLTGEGVKLLIGANDLQRRSFQEIANAIKSSPRDFFTVEGA